MHRARATATAVSTFCVIAATATVARGEQPYPTDIDQMLGVSVETIKPPMGCELCHTDPNGGTTSLRPFGQLMVSKYGLTTDTATLAPAVQALEMDNPKLVADLKSGTDPNTDVSDPVPLYGCSAAGRRGGEGAALVLLGMVGVAAALGRRARRRA
jgi:hypothetical protein